MLALVLALVLNTRAEAVRVQAMTDVLVFSEFQSFEFGSGLRFNISPKEVYNG